MAAARLAPLLSATSTMDRIWSIRRVPLGVHPDRFRVLLHHLNQTPTLGFGKRPAFLDADLVPKLGFALLIVGVKLLEARHHRAKARMGKAALHPNHNGLGHLVRDDLSQALLLMTAGKGRGGSGRGSCIRVWHRNSIQFALPACFLSCEMRVSIRAMSRRRFLNWEGFSNWLPACC